MTIEKSMSMFLIQVLLTFNNNKSQESNLEVSLPEFLYNLNLETKVADVVAIANFL
jgi:hypothetical protein